MSDTDRDDLLRGIKAISEFTGEGERRCFYLAEKGLIPAFKLGSLWYMRKSTYRTRIAQREAEAGGEAA